MADMVVVGGGALMLGFGTRVVEEITKVEVQSR